jgi:hypothetical protein
MLASLKESLTGSVESVRGFGETIESQPRLTTNFNRAKRNAAKALNTVEKEFLSEIQLIEGAQELLISIERPV